MDIADRYARFVTDRSLLVVVALLLATLAVGAGAGSVDTGLTIASFAGDSTEAQKLDHAETNFTTEGENATVAQVVVRGENVLSKESLVETLRLQQAFRENATVNASLAPGRSIAGIENLVATAAIRAEGERRQGDGAAGSGADGGEQADRPPAAPSLDAQIEQLERMSPAEVEAVVARVLDPDRRTAGPVDPYTLLATSYEAGASTADGRVTFVFQRAPESADGLPESTVEGQLAMAALTDRGVTASEAFVFGPAVVDERSGQATGESFALISPVALLLILVVLGVAYRDIVDVLLGLVGVALVLVWMGGFMGWAGIGVTQILIAVPFLLIGLSIDYALHVVMRYREAQADDPERTPREAMRIGLAGVVVAIGAATFTTAVGFSSNAVSPLQSIREFGITSAAGIVSAFVVFGAFVPALKLLTERALDRFGLARRRRAFGREGRIGEVLRVGATVARRAPVAVVLVALLVSAGGGYAATNIDTSIDQIDFLPRDSPEWMDSVPEPFRPGDYAVREQAIYLNEQFVRSQERSEAVFLVEGPVTDPDTLDRLAAGRERLANASTPVTLADDELQVTGPLETIRAIAAENESVAAQLNASDGNGDGVPDRDLAALYEAVYAASPDAASTVIYREGGEYRALRTTVALRGGADTGTVTEEMRAVADTVETGSDLTVTATGQPIVQELVQRGLLRTLVEGFLITLGVITLFLAGIFRARYGAASLGLVVVVPVVFALAWLVGTMYLLGISFNTETAIIASIAIGLGVDYAIHVGERFVHERSSAESAQAALDRTLRGTGGALLASAVTTASGFGVLLLALVPSLQRFGMVTSLAIAYSFVASVLVLPSLLVLWDRHVGGSAGMSRDEEAVAAVD
ncbi:efflux RND transporter permease subunit [Halosimplex sp. TS25]|uniref:efflux RND transporter permease subunit n=1 Tax=Halosimplex rarum TaxID=3396619 RepID=UPI0039EC77A1